MKRVYLAVFLVSVALLGFEVTLLQVLSFVQWHHFASMVISIALLGFGASGTVISLARARMLDRFDKLVPILLVACAIAMAVAVPLTQLSAIRFDSYLVFVELRHTLALILTYAILTIPFFLGALVIGLSFVQYTEDVGRLYFANLLGSSLGAVLPVMLMWVLPAAELAPLFALTAAAGGAAAAGAPRGRTTRYAAFGAMAVCLGLSLYPPDLTVSQFKDIRRTLDLPDSDVTYRNPSPLGLVQMVSTSVTRHAPGLSLQYRGELPVRDLAFINGNAAGAVGGWNFGDTVHVLDHTTRALPHVLGGPSRVLTLDAGTGEAVAQALSNGADHVVSVEPNVALTAAVRSLAESPLDHPDVSNRALQPRSYLRGSSESFDLINLPDVGRFGGSVGLGETQEDYLMTTEAFDEMWTRLGENGAIVIRVWMDYPYRYPLRVLALLAETTARNQLDPRDHIAAVRSWTDITFVATKNRVTPAQADRVRDFADGLGFDPLLLPQIQPGERDARNQLQDTTLFSAVDALVGPARDEFIERYEFQIAPPTDDKPYFGRFLRWSSLVSIADQFGGRTLAFFGLGLFIAALTLLQAVVLSFLLIIAPLFRLRVRSEGLLTTLLYFSALGVGFMFVEIVLIQQFTLYLGEPVYAVSAVLGGILVVSGMGAYRSSRLEATSGPVMTAAVVVGILGLLYVFALPPAFQATFGLPLAGRAAVALVLLAPISYAMGRPFPLGLRMISRRSETQVPWAWGVNGCLSVVGAAAAPLVSIEWGLSTLLIAGSLIYLLAGVVVLNRRRALLFR